MMVLCIILVGVAGGILIWQLLPTSDKQLIKEGIGVAGSKPVSIPGLAKQPPVPEYQFNQCAPNNIDNCCNGVETICDLRVSDVMFASLHNGHSSEDDGFLVAGNHEFKFELALQTGYRGLNLDLAMCEGKLLMIHGKCSLGSRDPLIAFQNIATFLQNNPRDVLLITMELVTINHVQVRLNDIFALMQTAGLTKYLYWHTNPTSNWPTMRQLIEADTRVLIFFYGGPSCRTTSLSCPPGFNEWFYYAAETEFEFPTVNALQNISSSCKITRGAGGYMEFFAVNNFVTNILPSKTAAAMVNKQDFLLKHIDACAEMNNMTVNVVFIDFWNIGNLVQVAQEYNTALGNGTFRQRKHMLRRLLKAR